MFGLLDLLATVATETLNNDESLKNVTTRPMSPNVDFADFRQESTKTSVKNPRRLTDFDVFGFHQVTKEPLSYKYSDLSQD